MLVFSKDAKRLRFVCQTGGKNAKVTWDVIGLESMVVISIARRQLPLTAKGTVHVFDPDTQKWLGSMKYKSASDLFPQKILADEDLTFKDFYTEAK